MTDQKVVVFCSSSTNTYDVFSQVFQNFEKNWPKEHYKKYVGLNAPYQDGQTINGFEVITAPVMGWREELAYQLNKLPENIDRIILVLDDFLIKEPINIERLEHCISETLNNNYSYLRLIPLSRSFLGRYLERLWIPSASSAGNRIIPDSEPYYSSLQIAIWKREHLQNLLSRSGNIWAFEHYQVKGIAHYAIINNPPIKYGHVVEKGKWLPFVPELFRSLSLLYTPGHRKSLPMTYKWRILWDRSKFFCIGFSWVKIKRIFS